MKNEISVVKEIASEMILDSEKRFPSIVTLLDVCGGRCKAVYDRGTIGYLRLATHERGGDWK